MSDFATVANTIRKQLGVFGLGVVGASKLQYTGGDGNGGLIFNARLHFKGQSRARVMKVHVKLTAWDTYDVDVIKPNGDVDHYATGMFAEDLTKLMYSLDSEGVEKFTEVAS